MRSFGAVGCSARSGDTTMTKREKAIVAAVLTVNLSFGAALIARADMDVRAQGADTAQASTSDPASEPLADANAARARPHE